MKNAWISLAAVCALVTGFYAYTAHEAPNTQPILSAASSYYNLLVQGFRAGQLSLKKEVPPGFAQLADPYDPAANTPYGLLDLSYYKGKFYLYFGVTPAVVLFWPYVALTGHYLFQRDAVVIFCLVGFLVSAGLLCALWRRYFAEVNVAVVAACALALGLVTWTPSLLARCDVYEVSISCGYALTMLALAAIWKALHEPEQRGWWLVAASLAYGLVVGARPNLLFGAVILLVPVVQAWRERRKVWAPLLAAMTPIALIGLGLMLYNVLRFDSPFEFGAHYQLTGLRLLAQQFFSLRHLWFNFRVYFLEPASWSGRFPFVHDIIAPALPVGHGVGGMAHPFGVLTNIPLVWLALAVPLAWRGRIGTAGSVLRWFVTAVALLFGICALMLGLFFYTAGRYEMDFLPALVLLAVIGILGLERAVAPTSGSGLAGQPVWRRAVRWGWSLLLGFSVAFSLLACVGRCAVWHNDFGVTLMAQGRLQEAIGHYEQALRLNPDLAEAHYNLGVALMQTGKVQEAIGHYQQALRIKPDRYEAHSNLGDALVRLGKVTDALAQYELASQIAPNNAAIQRKLGAVLIVAGKPQEAIAHLEQALRIKPGLAEAQNNLAWVLATLPPAQGGDPVRAVGLAQRACELTGNRAPGDLDTLAVAYAAAGRFSEAIASAQKAIDLARPAGQAALVKEIEARLELYRSGRAYSQPTGVTSPSNP